MRIIAIVLCALGFVATDARADILELLKTHKIVLGVRCESPCDLQNRDPGSEIRLINDVIAHVYILSKTGYIFPLKGEQDIRDHPLMTGYFQRHPRRKHYLKTRATASENSLNLTAKESYDATTNLTANDVDEIWIKVSGNSCTATHDFSWKSKYGSRSYNYQYPCAIVPLDAAAASMGEPKWRTLTFAKIRHGTFEPTSYGFVLINDRLYYNLPGCNDSNNLAVIFNWHGGSSKDTLECQGVSFRYKLSYMSNLKIDGNRREVTAKYKMEINYITDYDLDIRFVLDGGKCRIEKFNIRSTSTISISTFLYADAQSTCYLD